MDEEILDWLTNHDYGLQYSDLLERRQEGTGQWFLDSTEYQAWRETPNQTLFCPGIPGAGKTILASIIIEDLKRNVPDAGIIYIFCNFRRGDEQTLYHLIAGVLKQIVQVRRALPESLKILYETYKPERTRPTLHDILGILYSIVSEYSRLFVIIDALDECQISENCRNLFLDELFKLQKKALLNLCVTSRDIPEIKERFTDCTVLRIHADKYDVRRYLASHISGLDPFIARIPGLQEKIFSRIISAADGVYV
jgi:Cdc6-like AAA superfamily ATPase